MKKITKLVVLLLTLALLLGSVFAVTAFANEGEIRSNTGAISRESVVSVFDYATKDPDSANRMGSTFYKVVEVDEATGRRTISNNLPEVPASDAKSTSYINMSYGKDVKFENADFFIISMNVGTNDSYPMNEKGEGLAQLGFTMRGTGGVASIGTLCIVPKISENGDVAWYLCDLNSASSKDAVLFCEIDKAFELTVVLEKVGTEGSSNNYLVHIFVDGNYVGAKSETTGSSFTYTNQYRVTVANSDYQDSNFETKTENIWFENVVIDAVSSSNAACKADLAYIFKDGAPKTTEAWAEWETILYSVYDADGILSYMGNEIVATNGSESYSKVDPLRTAVNSTSTATISLKRDVVYKNKTSGASAGAGLFSLSSGNYTKTIYFNGCTLLHAPYYDNNGVETATRGHMFSAFGSTERTVNFIGGYNAFGDRGQLLRSAYQQSMFYGPTSSSSTTRDTNIIFNFEDLFINSDYATPASDVVKTANQFTTGSFGGTTWNFTNTELVASNQITFNSGVDKHDVNYVNFVNSKLNITKVRPGIKNCSVSFIDSVVYTALKGSVGNATSNGSATYGILETDATTTIYAKNTAFNTKDTQWDYYKDGTIASSKAYHVINSGGGKIVTLDDGCTATNSQTLRHSNNTYAPGVICFRDYNNSSATSTKKINLSANLTLSSDITYNIYIPTWVYNTSQNYGQYFTVDDVQVKYADFTEDDKVILTDGNEYFVYKIDFPSYEAYTEKTISFIHQYNSSATLNTSKTLSVTSYINTVLTNADNEASYAAAYTLMADIVDYVEASADYFGYEVSNDFAALKELDNYKANVNTNTEVVGAEVNYDNVKSYVKGAYLNVENSKTKFVFKVGAAVDKIELSYKSATRKTESAVFENCAENDLLALELRAYDLNAVITITVTDGENEFTGTYDLAAYANSEDAQAAADVLLAMYNYAVSAKAYKFGN